MLVLTRRVGERIRIGDDVTVTVVKIEGNVVRVGIDAPPRLNVVRAELGQPAADRATMPTGSQKPAVR